MREIIDFIKHLFESHYLIRQLTWRNVTMRYKRSYLGMLWSLMEPLGIMAVLYFVFGVGLRSGGNLTIPFICYLVCGMAVMNYFNEVFLHGVISIRVHSYLLKKVTFRMSVLPIVTVLTGLVNHLLFLIPTIIVLLINGIYPSLWWLQVFYYTFSLFVLLVGITWFTSSLGLFIPDLRSVINIISRLLFYATPVFWVPENMSLKIIKILRLNPLYYIAVGYRDSFLWGVGFWSKPIETAIYWSITLLMLVIGIFTFKKLRSQFADVV